MATAAINCAGCLCAIDSRHYLKCCLCLQAYDLQCANVPEKRFFNTMTAERKSAWECQQCRSNKPKSDNSNTPVRSTLNNLEAPIGVQTSPTTSTNEGTHRESLDNITFRRPPLGNKMEIGEQSFMEDILYLDHVRVIIREELQRALNECLPGLICKSVTDQIRSSISNTISQLNDRVSALEDKLRCFENGKSNALDTSQGERDSKALAITQGERDSIVIKDAKNAPGRQDEKETVTSRVSSNIREVTQPIEQATVSASPSKIGATHQDNPWVEVVKRRPRSAPQGLLRGTAAPGTTKLEASERQRDLHLFYVKLGTTEDQVKEHLKSVTGSEACKVESLKARGPYASFKLRVPSKLYERILAPEIWPEDVCIKPWHRSFRLNKQEDDVQ